MVTKLTNQQKAEKVYSRIYGKLDAKGFAARKTQEIANWINDGDADGATVEQLTREWREYDAEEIRIFVRGENPSAEWLGIA